MKKTKSIDQAAAQGVAMEQPAGVEGIRIFENFLSMYNSPELHKLISEGIGAEVKAGFVEYGCNNSEVEALTVLFCFINVANGAFVTRWCDYCPRTPLSFSLTTTGDFSIRNGEIKFNTIQKHGFDNLLAVYDYIQKKYNLDRNLWPLISNMLASHFFVTYFLLNPLNKLVNSKIAKRLKIEIIDNTIYVDYCKTRSQLIIKVNDDENGELEKEIRNLIRK